MFINCALLLSIKILKMNGYIALFSISVFFIEECIFYTPLYFISYKLLKLDRKIPDKILVWILVFMTFDLYLLAV